MKRFWLAADLDRCVGCHVCEVACKQENDLPEGTNWIRVVEIGPASVQGRLVMDFLPMVSDECDVCKNRVDGGLEPFCVSACPTDALRFLHTSDVLEELRNGKRVQIINFIEKLAKK